MWRVRRGNKNAWNLYLVRAGHPDRFMGVIFDGELADFTVDALNERIDEAWAEPYCTEWLDDVAHRLPEPRAA